MNKDKVRDVKGMTNKCCDEVTKPSYDDLKVLNEGLEKSCRRLQKLVFALERSLGMQVDEIIELEQDRDYYKQQYYKENERAERLFDKLEIMKKEKGVE